jgi:hypothetical protein
VSAELWQLAYATVRPKPRRDASAEACVDFLINERLQAADRFAVGPTSCGIREESWPLERLETLDRKHENQKPHSEAGPIIVFEHEGRPILIDGNNRVNFWRATRDR